MPLVVVRSGRRRRSAAATVRDGRLEVRVPAGLARSDESALVDRLVARVRARAQDAAVPDGPPPTVAARDTRGPRGPRGHLALVARADAVADRHLDGLRAERVTWSHRMQSRWGSCTPARGAVRVSSRLACAPDEVLDHLLLHELAHLVERGHGPAFRALVARDPHHGAADRWLAHAERHALREALVDV